MVQILDLNTILVLIFLGLKACVCSVDLSNGIPIRQQDLRIDACAEGGSSGNQRRAFWEREEPRRGLKFVNWGRKLSMVLMTKVLYFRLSGTSLSKAEIQH